MKRSQHSMRPHMGYLKMATLVAAAILLGASDASRAAGYLPVVGPAPLRFKSPPAPNRLLVSLPPLPKPSEPQPAGTETAPLTPPTPAAVDNPPSESPPQAIEMSTPPDFTAPPEEPSWFWPPPAGQNPSATPPTYAPQAILEYLLPGGTNGPAGRLLVPAFVPPAAPPTSHSSRATYESR